MSDDAALSLRLEAEALYADYVELLDEGPLADWPRLFLENASYRVVTRENVDRDLPLALIHCDSRAAIEDRVYAIEHTMLKLPRRTRHLCSGLRLTEAEGGWHAEANFAVFESIGDRPTACHAAGRYRDALARDDSGVLRFTAKLCICDSPLVRGSLVVPL